MEDLATLRHREGRALPASDRAHRRRWSISSRSCRRRGTPTRPQDGSVYFDVSKFKDYGALSGVKAGLAQACGEGFERPLRGEAGGGRLRALEGLGPRRRRRLLGDGAREGEARLAHRVLGDVDEVLGGDLRHPHRRDGQQVPAPRERDRPVGGRDGEEVRELLAPLGVPQRQAGRRCTSRRGTMVTLRELLERGWEPLTIRMFLDLFEI